MATTKRFPLPMLFLPIPLTVLPVQKSTADEPRVEPREGPAGQEHVRETEEVAAA